MLRKRKEKRSIKPCLPLICLAGEKESGEMTLRKEDTTAPVFKKNVGNRLFSKPASNGSNVTLVLQPTFEKSMTNH